MDAQRITTNVERAGKHLARVVAALLLSRLQNSMVEALPRQLRWRNETQMTSVAPLFRNYTEDRFIWEGGSFPYEEPDHQEGHEFYEKVIIIAPLVGAVFLLLLVAAGVYVLRHYDNETNEEDGPSKQRKSRKCKSLTDCFYSVKVGDTQKEPSITPCNLCHANQRLLFANIKTKLHLLYKRLTGMRKIDFENTLVMMPCRPQLVQRLLGSETPEILV